MTENPGTHAGLEIGDKVKVHSEGTSVFTTHEHCGDDALVESVLSAPGTYPFHTKLDRLVPVES
ncbi:hypothetical protein JWS13_05085 (plasmid) [Rhodococcus pseudokoreensis]|uniref:Uncharacterized protein n=1 Tax=Rhodococcus pseudokoreensis TaxID=2811421 RepID=A0A974VYT3_9NOCA|nr:hypothetical protein [Rhodococcus pseudokoreensis]QSE88034.1 hypothetical protein JWS13_05085 [Rhodococcus pseudokoreensis]